jgi:hypothetical protein
MSTQKYPEQVFSSKSLKDFLGEDEEVNELSILLTSLSTCDSVDSESTKEILCILDKRKGKYNSTNTISQILAPIPKKINSNNNILVQRVSRPYDTL